MKLYVVRQTYNPITTIGELIFNHKVFCYTLEDVVRPKGSPKVDGKTAIGAGCYEVVVDFSNHFQRNTAHILNVPNFDGIRMHGGNTAADTEGCVITAYNRIDDNTIQGTAEAAITEILSSHPGPHYIEIIDTAPYHGV